MSEADLKKTDATIRKMYGEDGEKEIPPEVRLGSREAPKPTVKLDPEKNVYEPKMYKKNEDHPPKGTIHIIVYPHKEYDIKFEGDLIGSDINREWRMMIRSYRLWKHEQSKAPKVSEKKPKKKIEKKKEKNLEEVKK